MAKRMRHQWKIFWRKCLKPSSLVVNIIISLKNKVIYVKRQKKLTGQKKIIASGLILHRIVIFHRLTLKRWIFFFKNWNSLWMKRIKEVNQLEWKFIEEPHMQGNTEESKQIHHEDFIVSLLYFKIQWISNQQTWLLWLSFFYSVSALKI